LTESHKLKHLTYDLIDIGLHEGQKGLKFVKSTQLYSVTDKYIKYDEKFEMAKERSIKAYRYFNDKIYNPIKENLIVFYDASSNYISVMVKLVSETFIQNQQKIIDYVRDRYDNVMVFIH